MTLVRLRRGVYVEMDAEAAARYLAAHRHKRAMISAAVRRGDLDAALGWMGHAERLQAVARWLMDGRGPLRQPLAEAWTGAEPDDTDPYYLALWRAISAGERIETEPMPPGDPLTVYRGQASADEPLGIAWTLDPEVARFFALRVSRTAGREAGMVLVGSVPRSAVLGYINEREEAEVVCDPNDVDVTGNELVRR